MNLVTESFVAENRINLTRILVILEKLLPELEKKASTNIMQMFLETVELVEKLNSIPYTKYNLLEWQVHVHSVQCRIVELKEEIIKTSGDDIDCRPLIKALDEVFIY